MKKIVASLFLLTLILFATGCGDGKSGAILKVQTGTGTGTAGTATTGDGDGDFPDRFLTPDGITVAFKSFKFFEQAGGTSLPGQARSTYTLFDATFDAPKIVSLKPGETIEVHKSVTRPAAGKYDRVEFEIAYFEMPIPLCRANDDCENRRVRFYLTDVTDPALDSTFAAKPHEILLSQSTDGLDFGLISSARGIPGGLIPIRETRPTDPVIVPANQLWHQTASGSPSLFVQGITLEIPRNPKDKYIFTLTFDISNLFFFDNTDEPEPEFRFNALTQSRDGKVLENCGTPTACKADFWPGIPKIGLTVAQE
ncbi:MAG: hypothetical protein WAO55_13290 [Candidatus Manganitrophaceae bacterium]